MTFAKKINRNNQRQLKSQRSCDDKHITCVKYIQRLRAAFSVQADHSTSSYGPVLLLAPLTPHPATPATILSSSANIHWRPNHIGHH